MKIILGLTLWAVMSFAVDPKPVISCRVPHEIKVDFTKTIVERRLSLVPTSEVRILKDHDTFDAKVVESYVALKGELPAEIKEPKVLVEKLSCAKHATLAKVFTCVFAKRIGAVGVFEYFTTRSYQESQPMIQLIPGPVVHKGPIPDIEGIHLDFAAYSDDDAKKLKARESRFLSNPSCE